MNADEAVLATLAAGARSTADCARATGLDARVCRRALHRLMARGLVASPAYARYQFTEAGRAMARELAAAEVMAVPPAAPASAPAPATPSVTGAATDASPSAPRALSRWSPRLLGVIAVVIMVAAVGYRFRRPSAPPAASGPVVGDPWAGGFRGW